MHLEPTPLGLSGADPGSQNLCVEEPKLLITLRADSLEYIKSRYFRVQLEPTPPESTVFGVNLNRTLLGLGAETFGS